MFTIPCCIKNWFCDAGEGRGGLGLGWSIKLYFVVYSFLNKNTSGAAACADPESFVKDGPTLSFFFKFDEERKDTNTTISGPWMARQQNVGGPMMAQY